MKLARVRGNFPLGGERSTHDQKTTHPYPADFRQKIVGLARSGRGVHDPAVEFNLAGQTIRTWIKQADLNTGRRSDGLTISEHDELANPRKESRQIKIERKTDSIPPRGSEPRPPFPTASAPDQLWVADIAYVPKLTGFLFRAIVLDVFSRRVVEWEMATHMRAELVVDALDMALHNRKPKNVIHHSDQRSQPATESPWVRLAIATITRCESFNAILECELLVKHRFAT